MQETSEVIETKGEDFQEFQKLQKAQKWKWENIHRIGDQG